VTCTSGTITTLVATHPAKRPYWIDSKAYPFDDQYMEVDGCSIHYVDEGSGPPLLLVHGNPTWSYTWRNVILGLRDKFRCIAPDLPGFGLSTARSGFGFTPAEIADVMDAFVVRLDLQGATGMGHDWGGPVVFRVAANHPERFSAFVIGNTWAWPSTDDRAARIFSGLLGGRIGGFLVLKRNVFVERIIPGGVKRTEMPEGAMDAYRGPFPTPDSRTPIHVLPKHIIASTDWLASLEHDLQKLDDKPVLLVWPTKDRAFGDAYRERWEQKFPHHTTVLLEGAGHYIGEDAADEIVASIRAWPQSPAA
jgi:haloalkane dehalogenase